MSAAAAVLPLRRSRDAENVDPARGVQSPSKAASAAPAAATTTTNNNATPASNSAIITIQNEAQLRALMERGQLPASRNAPEWLALIVHAPWAWPNFDANRGLLRCCTARGEPVVSEVCATAEDAHGKDKEPAAALGWPWIVQHSEVPIAAVSVAAMDNGGDIVSIIGIRAQGLPLVCLLKRGTGSNVSGYSCVAAKPIKNCIDIVSQTLLPPITNAAELDAALTKAAGEEESRLLVGYVGSAWCPPCCRVMPALPGLAAAFAPKGMRLVKMDFDVAHRLVAEQLGIEKIPTFVAFRPSDPVDGSTGVRTPFGSLQHSDAVRVSDQMDKWCDLVNAAAQKLTDDMFNDDDF